jgi:hypothetical protein
LPKTVLPPKMYPISDKDVLSPTSSQVVSFN